MSYTKIITHGGVFHADDSMAVAMLKTALGAIPVVRRDPTAEEMTDPAVIKVDVGGVFDVGTSAYDHHQRGFTLERDPSCGYGLFSQPNPLAAAGLVWTMFPLLCAGSGRHAVWHARVDELLVRGIDVTDCGKGERPAQGSSPSLSQCIAWLNPPATANSTEREAAFNTAVMVCGEVFLGVCRTAQAWIDARAVVEECARNRTTPEIMVLDKFVPWDEHVFAAHEQSKLLYVVFPSERGGYMVQQVPKTPGSFEGRKPLPAAWAGLRGADLAKVSGVIDATFCHPGRFCGGAASLAGTITMATMAVAAAE